ncbi:MAG: hypothetical protein MJB14_01290, partial [Spirochaetes bacterium]|nr:hypothetical protein [Spirochaetota bacterium]
TPEKYKKWTHIVMYFSPIIKYQALLSVPDDQPHVWEGNKGDSLNGWRFLTDSFIGYQFIIFEDKEYDKKQFLKLRNKNTNIIIGMQACIDYIDLTNYHLSPMADNGWGSDFCFVEFGPLAFFNLPHNFTIILRASWKNDRKATTETSNNDFYQDRIYDGWEIYFKRFNIVFGWKF